MTREEEIIIQSYDYGKYLLDTGFSTEEAALKCMRVAFIDGAKWADQTMIEKACKWLERNYHATPMGGYYYLPEDCIEQFKQAMKGE